ncbi:MAG: hypothetical protein IJT21_10270 [Synergistaceae bacterium]|nr:hypothetical protein [Synergistaceae bacterium]
MTQTTGKNIQDSIFPDSKIDQSMRWSNFIHDDPAGITASSLTLTKTGI